MRKIHVKIDKELETPLLGKEVSAFHIINRLEPNTIIMDEATEKPLIVFGEFEKNQEVKSILPSLKYTNQKRLTQMKNDYGGDILSQNFGFKPMRTVFQQPASASKFNSDYPKEYKKIASLGAEMMGLYKRYSEENYNRQIEMISEVDEQWKIPGTFFTQGVINDSVNFSYHYDRGNFKNCWSCMAVFREDVDGGELVIPGIKTALAIKDHNYVFFDGQSLLHGVTPIKKTSQYGRRFSIVFYALEAMKNCGTYEEEIAKARSMDMRKHKKRQK